MNELITYVKNKRGEKIGLILATSFFASPNDSDQKEVRLGWSMCCKKDRFDKERALQIARGRVVAGTDKNVPHTLKPEFFKMVKRSERYFKGLPVAEVSMSPKERVEYRMKVSMSL